MTANPPTKHRAPLFVVGRRFVAVALVVCASLTAVLAANPDQIEFFEKRIRPVLAEHCYSCHSARAEKVRGGLLLDTRVAMLKGGDSGPALVAGNPEASLLIKAVRYGDPNLQMPPKDKKLAPEIIADLETWVRMGAPDPRTDQVAISPFDVVKAKGREHWAFKPVARPALPAVQNTRWVQTPVDLFILSSLEAHKLTPSPQADRRTLIRRAYIDVLGLPPSNSEVEAFLADRSPDAFVRVVDRLLASPHYGERWGRHWLDVARYADTKGYVGGGEEARYPYAYTYRDWVIRSLNEDLPFDQFITQQIAADLLPGTEDNRRLAALGFLTLGRRFINNEADIIDDRLDVLCRGLMAVTIQCARCHDHKFDPVPTRDYYSLYGVFRSSSEPAVKPLLSHQPPNLEHSNYVAEVARREAELKTFTRSNETAVLLRLRQQGGEYLHLVHQTGALTNEVERENLLRQSKLNKVVRDRWTSYLTAVMKTNHPVFAPLFAFKAISNVAEFPAQARPLAARVAANNDPTNRVNPLVAALFVGEPPVAMTNVIDRFGRLLLQAHEQWEAALKLADPVTVLRPGESNSPPPTALPDPNWEQIRQVLYAADAPANPPTERFGDYFLFDDSTKNRITELKNAVAALDVTHPGAPARAMALEDKPKPENVRVFIRGNPGTPGAEAPRQFLEILSSPSRPLFPTNSSGRLELARAITSPENPLTARVFVNRVWLQYFGAGLVRTPGDFGLRCEPPSHPELLDWLASSFVEGGWSMKKLHRTILLSSAYQQTSVVPLAQADAMQLTQVAGTLRGEIVDPDNRLLWRQNRRRLDFEALRDSLLASTGHLDPAIGGRSVNIVSEPLNRRRTVYGFVDRQDVPNLFRVFDFANPDVSSPQRFQTTVAQQALFLMNSPMVIERAKSLVSAAGFQSLGRPEERVRWLYAALYQRPPTAGEVEMCRRFVDDAPALESVNPEASSWSYGLARYNESEQRVTGFSTFTHFSGERWQAGGAFPDPKYGYAYLGAESGHTAEGGLRHVVVRRWTAPRDLEIKITGHLAHGDSNGDGVCGRIIASRAGQVGVWVAQNNMVATSVEKVRLRKGDTLDFVVDCRESTNSDTFKWAPVVSAMTPGEPGEAMSWEAQKNFADISKLPKPMGAWEKLAQALLLANEFSFLD